MKKMALLLTLLFSACIFASSNTTIQSLRFISTGVKVTKMTPNPVVIAGGFLLGFILDEVIDYLEPQNNITAKELTSSKENLTLTHQNKSIYYSEEHSEEIDQEQVETSTEEAESNERNELPTVVIVHGFISSPTFHNEIYSPLTSILIKRGFDVYLAKVAKIKFAVEQAELLHQEIEAFIPKEKEIILIGHSLGGIVIRQYAHKHWKERRITNVISIASPHWGVNHQARKDLSLISKSLESLNKSFTNKTTSTLIKTTDYLSESYMQYNFNEKVKNVPGIDYLSTSTVVEHPFKRELSYYPDDKKVFKVVKDAFDSKVSDGLITVRTSMWGKFLYADKCVYDVNYSREIRGPLYEANHIGQISNLQAAFNLKNNAYRLGRDVVDYIEAHLAGGYQNPSHCDPF